MQFCVRKIKSRLLGLEWEYDMIIQSMSKVCGIKHNSSFAAWKQSSIYRISFQTVKNADHVFQMYLFANKRFSQNLVWVLSVCPVHSFHFITCKGMFE